jgi:SM-20-related protein
VFTANDLSANFEDLTEKYWTILTIDQGFALNLLATAQKHESSFRPATTSASLNAVKDIRSDQIYWLDENNTLNNETEKQTLKYLNQLRVQLQDYFRISLTHLETHFAIYNQGEKYVRHRDTTSQNNKRVFSFVIYLNEVWSDTDGGQLVGYKEESILFRVQPLLGQMILFRSDVEHEVLTAHKKRYSLTGWIRQ